jgi:putative peptidoglycan lipid II flippase
MTGMAEPDEPRPEDPDATVVLPAAGRTPYQEIDPTIVLSPVLIQAQVAEPGRTDPGRVHPGAAGPGTAARAGDPAAAAEADSDDTGAMVARHGSVMALGSLVSRLTGFLRTAAIGAAIGAAAVADDYNLANTLPGMVYELLLGGVLASVVVPLLVRARKSDVDRGEAYTQRLLSLAAIFLAGATVVAVAAAPLLTALFASDKTSAADRDLITTLSYLLLPMIFFYGMAALFAAVLNTRGHFAMPMWTPILNNFVVITAAAVFTLLPSATNLTAASISTAQILVLGLGTTAGIVVQAAGLWPALRKVGFRWRWRWDFRELRLRQLARVSAWMLLYVLVSQLALIVVLRLAKLAGDQGGPGPAIFNNAYLIFMMAHGIVAVSIITALMPRMSAAAADNRHTDLADHLSLGTRLTAVVLVPATAAYVLLGRPLAVTLFQWGAYTHEQAVDTGWVVAVAGVGLLPFAISQLQIFAFYAMPDTKTPALVNIPVAAVRVAVDIVLYVLLPVSAVAAGLMAGNAVSFVLAAGLGYWLLRRRIGRLGLARVVSTITRLMVAALIAVLPAGLLLYVLTATMGDGKIASLVQLVACGAVLIIGYAAAAFLLRVAEVREVVATVRGRLGR